MFSVILVILLLGFPAFAVDRSRDINQYGHAAWTTRDGAFKGYPSSIAQTPDGYLWLGTEFGVVRFDGVRFVPWEPPAGKRLPSNSIVKLLAGRDGSLWIGTTQGLARWKDGRLTHLQEPASPYFVAALIEDREGTVWVGTHGGSTTHARLCAIRNAGARCHGSDGTFGRYVISLHEDSSGSLWVGAATGLWRWKPGLPEVYPWRDSASEAHAIVEGADSNVLVALNREIRQVTGQKLEPYSLPAASGHLKPTALLRDRKGGLWIGTQDQGLLHVHGNRIDRFAQADGLSGDFVVDLFEDREGNIWVATLDGLDRFRETAVTTFSTKQGLSSNTVVSVLATRDGSVWLSTIDGLNRWNDGQIRQYRTRSPLLTNPGSSLFQDERGHVWVRSHRVRSYGEDDDQFRFLSDSVNGYVAAIAQDHEQFLWVSDKDRGLLRLDEHKIVELIPWARLGGRVARALLGDPLKGGVWLGFFDGGLAYLKDGQIRASYAPADGLGQGDVTSLLLQNGALWAATQGGLSHVKDGDVATLTSNNGLPCDAVHWLIEDDARAFWLRTACGLVRIDRLEVDAWARDPKRKVALTIFDDSDGVPSHSNVSVYSPNVTKAADGRLWFATYEGAGVIDPQRIPFNQTLPPVHIEEVTVDRKAYQAWPELRLPPLVRDLRIDYTAASLVAPQKVRFRYKLEGRDKDWVEAGNRRQAFYTDLPPGEYRFRVMASNNDGVWNHDGASWQFSIQPAFYQTIEFRIALAVFCVVVLWALYSIRLRRLAAQMNGWFEERLAERTRIAQELHDTLLQGSISAAMHLHVLADTVPDEATKLKLDRVLQRFRQSIDEGRQTVQTLRTSPVVADDLERALARDAEDLKGDQTIDIKVLVEGRHRPVHPLVRDECYRIGREALANAFRHAQATTVVIEVAYAANRLRLRIRDDGRGMDPGVLEFGRPGHWGLQGMRERARHIRATLKLRSRGKLGTQVELLVPGVFAFQPAEFQLPSGPVSTLVAYARRWRALRELLAKLLTGDFH